MTDARRAEHERGLARFVLPASRARFRQSFANERLRGQMRSKLAHFDSLDPRFDHPLTSDKRDSESIVSQLRGRGAPGRCDIVSESDDLDGREMDIEEALRAVVAQGWGTFVSCIPGKLAYFENEGGERHILQRPDAE